METTPGRIWTKICPHCRKEIVAYALSRLEKDEDEILSETEEGLVLSHAMCAEEQDEARMLPETKDDLVHHIMNVDEMDSEEFPMIH
jgi:hypothetical protein